MGTKMKKIICLLLVLTCAFALFSCGNEEIKAHIELVNASNPTNITTHTSYVSAEETLSGRFVTVIEGDVCTMTYAYERLADPVLDGGTERIKEVEGTVFYKDGKYSEDGENWSAASPDKNLVNIVFDLSVENLGNCKLSSDKKTLSATLNAEQAQNVLGLELPASEEGISLTVTHNGTYLTYVVISYVSTSGANVMIETSYAYN